MPVLKQFKIILDLANQSVSNGTSTYRYNQPIAAAIAPDLFDLLRQEYDDIFGSSPGADS